MKSYVKLFTGRFIEQIERDINNYVECSDMPIKIVSISTLNSSGYIIPVLVAFEAIE